MKRAKKKRNLRVPKEPQVIPGQREAIEQAWAKYAQDNIERPVFWEDVRANFIWLAERTQPELWPDIFGLINVMRDHYGD